MPTAIEEVSNLVRLCEAAFPYARARTGSDAAARVVIQNAVVSILERAAKGTLGPVDNPGGLLYTTVCRKAIDWHRREKKHRRCVALTTEHAAAVAAPPTRDEGSLSVQEDILRAQKDLERIWQALTDDDKVLLKMKYLNGRTLKEIGEHLDIGESGASQRVTRLLKKLKKQRALFNLDYDDTVLRALAQRIAPKNLTNTCVSLSSSCVCHIVQTLSTANNRKTQTPC